MFHVNGNEHVMAPVIDGGCRAVMPSPQEQFHAALVYARPRGNRDPDRDPGGFALARPGRGVQGAPGRP
jgi:hypothetical protein